jgi:plastocyanin
MNRLVLNLADTIRRSWVTNRPIRRALNGVALLPMLCALAACIRSHDDSPSPPLGTASRALSAYQASLSSPTPPEGATTFVWQTEGSKGTGREIGHVELRGCWTASQIASATAVNAHGAPVSVKVHKGGPKANAVETGDVSDCDLPLQITVALKQPSGSADSGTDLFVKTGGGPKAGPHFDVGGPTCAEPVEPDEGETFEEASPGALALASPSEQTFAPLGGPVRFELTGATLSADPSDVRAFANGQELPSGNLQLDGDAVVLNGALSMGSNELLVLAADNAGRALSAKAYLWAGSATFQVAVADENGQPAEGALVSARLGDDQSIRSEAISSNGLATFQNVPNWTIVLQAQASGNRFATAAAFGGDGFASLRLRGFDAPSLVDNNDFSQGTAGWNIVGAPVQILPHVEGGGGLPQPLLGMARVGGLKEAPASVAAPRDRRAEAARFTPPPAEAFAVTADMDLVLNTLGEGARAVSRAFPVAPGASSIVVRFRFITSEVPGGWFGSEFNDYYSVSIRSQGGGDANADSNTMNGLGLPAFDGAGATAWREVTLPVNQAGDVIQVDALVANVADGLFDSQVVVDVVEEQFKITVDKATACPNETVTFRPEGTPAGTIGWTGGGNPATGAGNEFATRFAATGDYTVQATLTNGASVRSDSKAVHVNEASGAGWVARFPTSTATADLNAPFGGNVDSFIAAMQAGGATVTISATYRPAERAYLMHYSHRIAQGGLDPATVPAMAGVDICWLHRDANGNADVPASRAAAQAMVNGYSIVHPPALQSRHTERRAIDMSISWGGNLTLNNATGNAVTITTTPRGGGNTNLHAVGATYGVIKLVTDAPHWSDDGHLAISRRLAAPGPCEAITGCRPSPAIARRAGPRAGRAIAGLRPGQKPTTHACWGVPKQRNTFASSPSIGWPLNISAQKPVSLFRSLDMMVVTPFVVWTFHFVLEVPLHSP